MSTTVEKTLDSGAVVKITIADFKTARNLYQAILSESNGIKLNPSDEVDANLFKDLFCTMLSSKKVEQALWACMPRVTYNDLRVTEELFEDVKNRADYLEVLVEVARENIAPFVKSLYARYSPLLAKLAKNLK